MDAPVAVDMDLVRRLRAEGRRHEAEEHLRAFRASCEQNKRQQLLEIRRRDRLIERKIKKQIGACSTMGCDKLVVDDYAFCAYHLERRREAQRIRREYERLTCMICGGSWPHLAQKKLIEI